MCGRYVVKNPVTKTNKLVKSAIQVEDNENYNAHPYQKLPVIKKYKNGNTLEALTWGLIPSWAKDKDFKALINARLETIDEKVSFKKLIKNNRCVAVADGFYEWQRVAGQKPVPYRVMGSDGSPLVMAGIWQDWQLNGAQVTSCAIVTTNANPKMARIHHRLPVILEPEDWPLWLGEQGKRAAKLMRPVSDQLLDIKKVSNAVNSNRSTGAELWQPVSP